VSTFLLDLVAHLANLGLCDFAGMAGVALGSSWALFRQRRTILVCQSLGSLGFAFHYLLLGSGTAAVACTTSLVQSLSGAVAGSQRPRWLAPLYAATFLIVLATAYLAWHGLPSICAAGGAFFAMLGRWQREPQRMRLVFLASSSCWVLHNSLVGTPFGLASDTLALSAILLGLYRNRRSSPAAAVRRLMRRAFEPFRAPLGADAAR
jgi:hypothetical protein